MTENDAEKEVILHEFVRDEDGDPYHNAVECVRCGEYFCTLCYPKKLHEPCGEQTPYLF